MSSSTSLILTRINTFRNSAIDDGNFGKIILAQIAYVAIIPYSIIEMAISQVAKAIARCAKVNDKKYQAINAWATSSAYSALWTVICAIRNLCERQRIIATEDEFRNLPMFRAPRYNPVNPRPVVEPRFPDFGPIRPAPFDPEIPQTADPGFIGPLQPPKVEPAVANLLKNYEIADNAKKYTDIFERVYRDLPDPSLEEVEMLMIDIAVLLQDKFKENPHHPANMMDDLRQIAYAPQRNPADDHFIKVLMCVYKTIMETNDQSTIEIMKMAFMDANSACRTRRNDEIQRLFFSYAAPRLNLPYLNGFTPLDSLIFEFMQYRIKLRDQILNIVGFNDTHDRNYLYRKLNVAVFHLPFPALSVDEGRYMRAAEQEVIDTFRTCYDSPKTLYTVFTGLLYPKTGEVFKYKTEWFTDWLKEKDLMNADAFEDEMYTKYKPKLVIEYLVEMGIFQEKSA